MSTYDGYSLFPEKTPKTDKKCRPSKTRGDSAKRRWQERMRIRGHKAARLRKLLYLTKGGERNQYGDPIPKPVTLPYVSIQHVDMEKLP